LNPSPSGPTPNLVITKPSAAGTVCLFTATPADLFADLTGYQAAGSAFVGVNPSRLLDTRSGSLQVGYQGTRPHGGQTVVLDINGSGVPADAAGVVLNVTAVNADSPGYVTVWPCDSPRPLASNLNPSPSGPTPNLVITKPSAAGTVCLFTATPADLFADLTGYQAA
jgi:hypothetical protein